MQQITRTKTGITAPPTSVPEKATDKRCADSAHAADAGKLSERARERALGVLADPASLVQAGTATAMLAYVNKACGDQEECTIRYADVAHGLDASVSTVKAWADTLDKLGYFTRAPQGRSGVLVRLNAERWPTRDNTQATAIGRAASIISATRTTLGAALDGALAQLQTDGGAR